MSTTHDTTPAPAYGIDVQAVAGEVRLDVAGELVPLYLDEARDWAEGVQKAWTEGQREIAANLDGTGVFVIVEVDDEGTRWDAVAFDGDHYRYEYPAAPDLRRLQSWLADILRGSRPR